MAGESKKGAYRKFRELLRCGIGDRSQRSFAKEAGITPEHVFRDNQPALQRNAGENGFRDEHGVFKRAFGGVRISDC